MGRPSGERFRLIQHGAASGPFNMGFDEAMLRTAASDGIATLRLYTWDGPWLSLGYAQRRIEAERMAACEQAGVGIVRRTTGGRAVLHGNDLTYSLAAPEAMLRPGLRNSYDQVATALLAGVRSLGAKQASRVPETRGARPSKEFDCFAQPAGDEIVVGVQKLVGSAQRRRGGAVLQHGSIRLGADSVTAAFASGVDPDVSTNLFDLGIEICEADLRTALVEAFCHVLGTDHLPEENPRADELAQADARVSMHHKNPLDAPSSKTP